MYVQAIVIGMPDDIFWHGDPRAFGAYIDAWLQKQRQELSNADMLAWLTGRYTMLGHGINLAAAFGKGGVKDTYPEQPVVAVELDEKAKERYEEEKMRRQHAQFLALVKRLNANITNGKAESNASTR